MINFSFELNLIVLSYFTKLVARFRSKEGYTVFLKTTDNSFGRKLSAFLPYSKTHAPDQDQTEVLRPRRGKQ